MMRQKFDRYTDDMKDEFARQTDELEEKDKRVRDIRKRLVAATEESEKKRLQA